MKVRPLNNLLKHNQNIIDKYKENGVNTETDVIRYAEVKAWRDCTKYIIDNYKIEEK